MFRRFRALLAATAVMMSVSTGAGAQTGSAAIRARVSEHFLEYSSDTDLKTLKVQRTDISTKSRRLDIYLNENFGWQQFRPALIDSIYDGLRNDLQADVRRYSIRIYAGDKPIESLVPNWARSSVLEENLWHGPYETVRPWVSNDSRPFIPQSGMQGLHIAVTPSHGYYYERADTLWEWQRPPLFCSREDLLTQSFVYPYLIPMLENAGAVVWSARERDWQSRSVTVKAGGPDYREDGMWTERSGGGWVPDSARICADSVQTVTRQADTEGRMGTAMWIPEIPADGDYAVYVTYQSSSTSTDDARYIVFHTGGSTIFRVNQQIGSGTWVYLGTFHFKKGRSPQGMVTLDNSSSGSGTVNADAVRFGGGTATEIREDMECTVPRYNEGSKYYARFAGAPDSIYSKYDGKDDYREDIWARPYMSNWISGGSFYNNAGAGLGVPVELYFALHTDAGYFRGDTLVGSLGICTTGFNDGMLGNGYSRAVSRDLTDMVIDGLRRDLGAGTGRDWTYRGIWDRDYCESREPMVPAMLLELLSHQNYWDMQLALDPNFRFLASRSIYKSILRHTSFMHGLQYVVQPLPVDHFSISRHSSKLELEWQAVTDSMEATAQPTGYVVYTAAGDAGFDNGTYVKNAHYTFTPEKDIVYRFKVTAANAGGESMPSEILAACISAEDKGTALIINGFQRLAAPETVETDSTLGFDILSDPGVQYIKSPILCGAQQIFSTSAIGLEEEISLGISDDRYDGRLLAGNSFDYPAVHGMALAHNGWSFVSCSRESVQDGKVSMNGYRLVDLILGLQKRSLRDSVFNHDYSTFPKILQRRIETYLKGNGRLLVSGSFAGADMISDLDDEAFTMDVLHYRWEGPLPDSTLNRVSGMRSNLTIRRQSDEDAYGVPHPDVLSPTGRATRQLFYGKRDFPAAVGYSAGDCRTLTIGFPFECIEESDDRDDLMKSAIRYLTDN